MASIFLLPLDEFKESIPIIMVPMGHHPQKFPVLSAVLNSFLLLSLVCFGKNIYSFIHLICQNLLGSVLNSRGLKVNMVQLLLSRNSEYLRASWYCKYLKLMISFLQCVLWGKELIGGILKVPFSLEISFCHQQPSNI